LFIALLWVVFTAMGRVNVPDTIKGGSIIVAASAYSALITWVVMSGNVPFMATGG